ncbi:MAG TPA: SAM-dependent methyltransferase [Chloroflexia bacterium]|nr:SAM-dependent methyltransferase [Chloroflexia bacterium]
MSSTGDKSRSELLLSWLRDQIRAHGPITVAQFMEQALYHPHLGYYTSGPNIGPRGDFVTSPEASPAFGKLLASHVADVDALLGKPPAFDIVEGGPGMGTLARDLLDELHQSKPDLYSRVRYRLVELSPALTQAQRALLQEHGSVVEWHSDLARLQGALQGAVIANELVDAFPVHVLENHAGTVWEQHVTLDEAEELAIVLLPISDPSLNAFLDKEGIVLAPGEQVEVNLLAEKWLSDLSSALARGVVTLIDYGDESPARYSAARREGTLLGYYAGGVTGSILSHPGEQDLTALVDFTALQHSASHAGFDVIGLTRQSNFLIGLGLGTTHTPETVYPDDIEAAIRYRRGIQTLISMEGLGRFHVLLLSKGIEPEQALPCLSGLKYAAYLV